MSSIGRNDPCPCGSGKKYKRCHGALAADVAPSPEATRAAALKACDVALAERLLRFARSRSGPEWFQDALDATGLDGLTDAEMPFVVPWLLHLSTDADGRTLGNEFRRLPRARLSSDETVLLDAYERAWVSIWEVASVEPGVGSRVRDLLTREERFVHDVSSTAMLQPFDSLLAIILSIDGISFFGGAHAQPLSPRFTDLAVREARRLCRVRTRAVSTEKLRDNDLQLEMLALWNDTVDQMMHQPPPVMQNTDGDPFAPTRDDFALVGSRADVELRLESLPEVQTAEEDGDDTVFVITKAGNAVHTSWDNTIIGRIAVSANRLTAETNSTSRADALRSVIETSLRGLVRFRLRTEENASELVAAARTAPPGRTSRSSEEMPPEAIAAVRQFRERHLQAWIDDQIPALDGLTPREAARSPRARPKLEVLLKEMEQSETRLPAEQRLDLRPLRKTLGFA